MRIVYDYSDYDNVKTHMFYLCGVQEGVKHIEVKNPVGFQEMFEFSPDWNKLFQLTAKGEQALKLSEEIKKWDSNNKSERTTYERLKLKFGDSQ